MYYKANEPIYITKNDYGNMVIVSMEIYESTMHQISMYRNIEISKNQIKSGQVKVANIALQEMRTKYDI